METHSITHFYLASAARTYPLEEFAAIKLQSITIDLHLTLHLHDFHHSWGQHLFFSVPLYQPPLLNTVLAAIREAISSQFLNAHITKLGLESWKWLLAYNESNVMFSEYSLHDMIPATAIHWEAVLMSGVCAVVPTRRIRCWCHCSCQFVWKNFPVLKRWRLFREQPSQGATVRKTHQKRQYLPAIQTSLSTESHPVPSNSKNHATLLCSLSTVSVQAVHRCYCVYCFAVR